MKSAVTASFFCALLVLAASTCAGEAGKPNIVILFADDMGYADLGSYGNPYIRTPNLDQLAREGQRWTDFYVSSPVCSPSRGSLMTGKVPVKSGLYGRKMRVMHPGDPLGIPREELTLAEGLKQAGYRTGMFGKWHLGDAPEHYPTRNGFDYWYGVPYSNDMDRVGAPAIDEIAALMEQGKGEEIRSSYLESLKLFEAPKSEYWHIPLYRSVKTPNGYKDTLLERPLTQETFTRRLTQEAIKFIRENKNGPFLVYLPYSMPHLPIFRSEAFADKSLRGRYGDAVEEIDWSVGRIREVLEELGIAENTLVFFSSDNGPWQAVSIDQAGSAGMLRGSKGTTFEGGMRVPGIFWWPGKVKPGTVSGIGSTMDVYATALRLAGVEAPGDSDGLDLTPTLTELKPSPREEMPYYLEGTLRAYRAGPYKLHFVMGGAQLGEDSGDRVLDKPVLYNLLEDLGEQRDIAGEKPEIVASILAAVKKHKAGLDIKEPIFDKRFAKKEE